MSAISLKSITGITSITTPAGVDNQLTLHTNNTTERVKIDIAGNVHVNNHLAVSGVTTTTDNINIDADNKKLQIGDSQDLELFHNGTNSVINNTEGALLFQNNGSSSMYIASDGQVSLNNDITFIGASANALWDKSENYFSIPDKIVHSGDTNTAIRFPTNDQISFETGGSEQMKIAGVNITLGTNSTTGHILQIKNRGNDCNNTGALGLDIQAAWMRIGDALSGGAVYGNGLGIKFHDSGVVHWSVGKIGSSFYISNTSNSGTQLFPSSRTDALVFTSGGNATFSNNATVSGNLILSDQIQHNGDTDTKIRFPAADTISMETAGSERLRITSSQTRIGSQAATDKTSYEIQFSSAANNDSLLSLYNPTSTDGESVRQGFFFNNSSGNATEFARIESTAIETQANSTLAGDLRFYTTDGNDTPNMGEKLRIDSSGRVMIGTTTEGFAAYGDKFTIADSGHCGMTIRSGTSSYGTIYFSDADDGSANEVRGFLEYYHNTNALSLGANGSPRLRINSVGQTRIGGSLGDSFQCDLDVVRNNSTLTDVMLVKGNSSNGFIRFQDNDNSCNFTFGADDGSGLGTNAFILYDRNNSAYRWSVDNSGNMKVWDGNIQLASGHGIDFSATGDGNGTDSSELLDDYEEGSFTPVLQGSTGSGTASHSYQEGHYTKVGRLVTIFLNVYTTSTASWGGNLRIAGFPYACASAPLEAVAGAQWNKLEGAGSGSNSQSVFAILQNGNSYCEFRRNKSDNSQFGYLAVQNVNYLRVSMSYYTG